MKGLALSLLVALGAIGCASAPPAPPVAAADCGPADVAAPVLRLAPAALGRELAVQQQLTVTAQGRTQRIDVLLEADAAAVRLALVHMGQTAARLTWDGRDLQETRAPWLPEQVSGERILSDLQLAMWPATAVRAALPPGWFLDTTVDARLLRHGTATVVAVSYPSASRIEIDQRHDKYRLVVDTREMK